ncbi:unnamed protein product [Camellia sinensis]
MNCSPEQSLDCFLNPTWDKSTDQYANFESALSSKVSSPAASNSAVPFPSTPFQYPVFPFGTSFPLSSANFSGGSTTYVDSPSGGRFCFPAGNSQLLGPAATVSSQYPRPYVVSLPPDGSNNIGVDNSRKWARQGLDLNVGPVSIDIEGREETLPLASRQLSVASSQVLAEEQAMEKKMEKRETNTISEEEPTTAHAIADSSPARSPSPSPSPPRDPTPSLPSARSRAESSVSSDLRHRTSLSHGSSPRENPPENVKPPSPQQVVNRFVRESSVRVKNLGISFLLAFVRSDGLRQE